jgi:hypothetical protein
MELIDKITGRTYGCGEYVPVPIPAAKESRLILHKTQDRLDRFRIGDCSLRWVAFVSVIVMGIAMMILILWLHSQSRLSTQSEM